MEFATLQIVTQVNNNTLIYFVYLLLWQHHWTIKWLHANPPLFIEVPIRSQRMKRSCICIPVVSVLSLSVIFLLNVGFVPTVVFFSFFLLF